MIGTNIVRDASRGARKRSALKVWWVMWAVAAAACTTLTGTKVTKDSPPEAKRALVESRVKERWDALIKGDAQGAYALLSPATRATRSIDDFKARQRLTGFTAAKIDSIECEAEACKVMLTVTYDHRVQPGKTIRGIETPLEETWLIDEGQAWYVFRY